MNWKPYAFILLVLVASGLITRPVEDPAWSYLKEQEPALQLGALEEALGQGVTVALLGGFRAIFADFLWLRASIHWEEDDLPGTYTMLHLVTTIDPRPLFFWRNGAGMIAFDMPVWRVRAAGGYDEVPSAVAQRIHAEQGHLGVNFLQRAIDFHPDEPILYVDIANIYYRRIEDVEMAAEYYRIAAERGAPAYAARIYAQLLREMGEDRAAYEWLVQLYPTLDDHDVTHQKPVVLQRIRDLEEALEIPLPQRFRPETGAPFRQPAPPGFPDLGNP
ncbi:MAG: hypothetical protein WD490_06315 [Opitutales bacterium]